jgi:hypothetical protein
VRISPGFANFLGVRFHERRLPHLYETNRPVFLTWRLHDSLPRHREFPKSALTSGEAFAAMIVDAVHYNSHILCHYALHAFVVIPITFICWLLEQ